MSQPLSPLTAMSSLTNKALDCIDNVVQRESKQKENSLTSSNIKWKLQGDFISAFMQFFQAMFRVEITSICKGFAKVWVL